MVLVIEPISNRASGGQSLGDSEGRPVAAAVDGGYGDDDPVARERPVQCLEDCLRPLRIPFHETRRYRFCPVPPLFFFFFFFLSPGSRRSRASGR